MEDFQSLAVLPLPKEDRAWAGQLSDLDTLSRSQVSITPHSREAVTLSEQDNSRNIARGTAATTIRICEKGK